MTEENGRGRTAVLYARVSTDEQARSGYSLAQQIERLRGWAEREGYEVLQEVTDRGQSGADLVRPGLDRVRDLVQGTPGGVSVVVAQDRDRFAREPAYLYLLRREFEEYGTIFRALNDRGDESSEGELTDGILDQLAKFERAKTAERTRRGKLQKVAEGKILRGPSRPYGFRHDEGGEALLPVGEELQVLRSIFRMVGVEGLSLGQVVRRLKAAGVPSPTGGNWHRPTLRNFCLSELYRPLSAQEVADSGLVRPEIARALDVEGVYGLWCFNRLRRTSRRERADDGTYRERSSNQRRPREEWVAVPVNLSDAGLSRAVVDAARERLSNNHRRPPSTVAQRFWQLSGGIARCGGCGSNLSPHTTTHTLADGNPAHYPSYRCRTRYNNSKRSCDYRTSYPAEVLEHTVWLGIYNIIADTDRLKRQWDEHIERKRRQLRGDPGREARTLAERLQKLERRRSGYLDLAADGDMSREELRTKLAEVDGQRAELQDALREVRNRQQTIEDLERERREGVQFLYYQGGIYLTASPQDRRRIYQALQLQAEVDGEGQVRLSGIFSPDVFLLDMVQDPPDRFPDPLSKFLQGTKIRVVSLDTTSGRR